MSEITSREPENGRAVFEEVAFLKAHYEHTADKSDVERVRVEIANIRTEIAKVRGDSQTGMSDLQARVSDLKFELVKWVIGVGLAAAIAVSAIASVIISVLWQ